MELLGGWSPFSSKDKVKMIKNWLKKQSLLSIYQKKEPEMNPDLEREVPVASPSFRKVQRQSQNTSEETERSKEGSSHEKSIQYGQNPYQAHIQGTGKYEKDFYTQIIHPVRYIRSIIDSKVNNFDKEVKELSSKIKDLRKNDQTFTEWCKVKNSRLESISKKCDRIGSKFQVKSDELENILINQINDQLTAVKYNVLEIVDNTNPFATHLERHDSERNKLKNEVIEHVEQINNKNEPNSHMHRNSTPLTK
ncbi:hypothetical protein O181_026119 [Austropuccinia psidii MF-1]|uniref:Uncharacterized protein n=1 Tax=Austropuccinia psidii MF-1 TaxID=1389203 RepID=A0A9Q3CJC8_9BASI|nr:hypothetical protein [Austropuccinia psidii MF-1]